MSLRDKSIMWKVGLGVFIFAVLPMAHEAISQPRQMNAPPAMEADPVKLLARIQELERQLARLQELERRLAIDERKITTQDGLLQKLSMHSHYYQVYLDPAWETQPMGARKAFKQVTRQTEGPRFLQEGEQGSGKIEDPGKMAPR